MWLIEVRSMTLKYVLDAHELSPDGYAILSHTWRDGEVSFAEFTNLTPETQEKPGYAKITSACRQARKDGLSYIWCDTCCIDKSSSAELSEAINSMWRWYRDAEVCYAYLADMYRGGPMLWDGLRPQSDAFELGSAMSPHPDELSPLVGGHSLRQWCQWFAESRWFKRGWTLQELIAPRDLRFFDQAWNIIGVKSSLIETLNDITDIDRAVLRTPEMVYSCSVAKRMSWAAKRSVSRPEDRAYSLLGIFDVNMPLIYGEGEKAFMRLQEEIVKRSSDQSIFAWDTYHRDDEADADLDRSPSQLLAHSPQDFIGSRNVVQWSDQDPSFELTNQGLKITLTVMSGGNDVYFGLLNCRYADDFKGPLALRLRKVPPIVTGGIQQDNENVFYLAPARGERFGHVSNEARTFVMDLDRDGQARYEIFIRHALSNSFPYQNSVGATKLWVRSRLPEDWKVTDAYPHELWDLSTLVMSLPPSYPANIVCSYVLSNVHRKFLIIFRHTMAFEDYHVEVMPYPVQHSSPVEGLSPSDIRRLVMEGRPVKSRRREKSESSMWTVTVKEIVRMGERLYVMDLAGVPEGEASVTIEGRAAWRPF